VKQEGGIALTVANLRSTCDELVALVGHERFHHILATFNPEKTKGLATFLLHRSQAHPLAIEWRELTQAVENSERANKLLLPERSCFLLDQLIRLRSLTGVAGIDELLNRLSNSNEYYSALFEIFILSAYRQAGADIEIVPRKEGKRTSDFVMRFKKRNVYVECKSLEDRSRKEQRIWEQIEGRVIKALSSRDRSWRVTIKAQRTLEGRDIPSVASLAWTRIQSGSTARARTPDGSILVDFEPFPTPEVWQPGGVESIQRRSERGYVEAEQFIGPTGGQYLRNIMMVESQPFYPKNETPRILSCIKNAHGQIPKGACGIVHIEVPFRNSARILDVADLAFQRAFGFLKQRRRLNAAVLSSRTLNPNMKEGDDAIFNYFVVVPNAKPDETLPPKFRIVGADDGVPIIRRQPIWEEVRWWAKLFWRSIKAGNLFLPKRVKGPEDLESMCRTGKGTILLEFGINEPLSSQLGRSVINYCSADGARQLRLWQSFKNHFRADIVDLSFGRRTFRANLNDLTVGGIHKLAIAWSHDAPTAAVDGRMLEEIPHGEG
jgi:hypothetical protein